MLLDKSTAQMSSWPAAVAAALANNIRSTLSRQSMRSNCSCNHACSPNCASWCAARDSGGVSSVADRPTPGQAQRAVGYPACPHHHAELNAGRVLHDNTRCSGPPQICMRDVTVQRQQSMQAHPSCRNMAASSDGEQHVHSADITCQCSVLRRLHEEQED